MRSPINRQLVDFLNQLFAPELTAKGEIDATRRQLDVISISTQKDTFSS